MATKEIPTFEQVQLFMKNISNEHLNAIKAIIAYKEDLLLFRQNKLKEQIAEFYPEVKSLMERGKKIGAIKFIKAMGFIHDGNECSFSIQEVNTALELEFPKAFEDEVEYVPDGTKGPPHAHKMI